jgi:hypothetical protein
MVNPGVHPKPTRFGEFVLLVMRRHANREIVQVNLKTTSAAARSWMVFGNHWPSRRGGQFRRPAQETWAYR